MKEYLADRVKQSRSPGHARNEVREYLQARVLGALQRVGAMTSIAFQGGTALRFLYAIPRYSEDLDFSLERDQSRYALRRYLRTVQSEFTTEGYAVRVKLNDRKVVHSAFIRFPGLLYELGLSAQTGEVLAVKLEVDTRPPAGATMSTTVVRRHVVLHLHHHDRASLLAGKLHAILQPPYPKGRDAFDLLWYSSSPDWPQPNLHMLNNALQQSSWQGEHLDESNWRRVVRERVLSLDWQRIVTEVRPFVEPTFNLSLLSRETLLRALTDQ